MKSFIAFFISIVSINTFAFDCPDLIKIKMNNFSAASLHETYGEIAQDVPLLDIYNKMDLNQGMLAKFDLIDEYQDSLEAVKFINIVFQTKGAVEYVKKLEGEYKEFSLKKIFDQNDRCHYLKPDNYQVTAVKTPGKLIIYTFTGTSNLFFNVLSDKNTITTTYEVENSEDDHQEKNLELGSFEVEIN